jgi:hypothetical protein
MHHMRLSGVASIEVEDPRLDELNRAAISLLGPMGASDGEVQEEPFDLEVVKPRALDLRKLWKLAGKAVPPDVAAALGRKVPVLLYQGMTAFHKPGRRPAEVWGMGYEVRTAGDDCDTVSLAPDDRIVQVGAIDQEVEIGLSLGGELGVPEAAIQAVNTVPGVVFNGAQVKASTDQKFALAIHFKLTLRAIQAAPVGAGGAKWNVYRQTERLDGFQALMHTLLVPRGMNRLTLTIATWVRRSGGWFGLGGSREWRNAPETYQVSLEGLEEGR